MDNSILESTLAQKVAKEHGEQNGYITEMLQKLLKTHLQLVDKGLVVLWIEAGDGKPVVKVMNNEAAWLLKPVTKIRRKGVLGVETVQVALINDVQVEFTARGH